MKHHRIGLVAASLLLAFAAQAETIKIGAVQGLSGPPAIVDFGESYLQGNQLALKEYNATSPKHKIEFIVYNDEANPQRAVSLVQRLISNDKVSAIVDLGRNGQVAGIRVPTRKEGIHTLPAAVAMSEVDASLRERARGAGGAGE